METCDKTEIIPDDYVPSVMHGDRVLATALDTLQKMEKDPLAFSHTIIGGQTLLREGKKRKVTYVEVSDGSGPSLRIEVFITEHHK